MLKPGTVTKLTKFPVATQVDVVTMKGGKVLERIQYKDTPSVSGIHKTLKQVESGKYRQTQLRGTTETAEKFNRLDEKRGISKRMESTGISSKTTNRIGDKFTGQTPKMANIRNATKTSAIMAAGLTVGVEVFKSIANGDSVGECTGHVILKSAESAIIAAVSTAVAEATFGIASSLLASSCIRVAGPLIVAGAVAIGVGSLVGEAISDACFNIGCFFDGLFV